MRAVFEKHAQEGVIHKLCVESKTYGACSLGACDANRLREVHVIEAVA